MDPRPALSLPPSPAHGRLCVVLAAGLWSLSGLFTRALTHDTPLRLGPEAVGGLTIAFYRPFFASLVLLPTVRRRDVSWRWPMAAMVGCFAAMNLTFALAMSGGRSSNAILLQYTAPMWMYLASVWWLGEAPQRRAWVTLALGLGGVGFIIWGGWQEASLAVIGLGLASGIFYAGVVVWLRVLRDGSPRWLTVLNHAGSSLVLVPVVAHHGWPELTAAQLAVLGLFGTVQMALPYWLMARGMRAISPQEAGAITLLEPLLNPLWAYLAAPDKERPTWFTLIGGAFILGGLVWRYGPWSRPR